MYKPISETSQLPPLGPLAEDLRLDMKMMLAREVEPIALACDVAAFANTAGGVLLIGAHEHPKDSGILHNYVTMTYADAQALGATLKKALQLCSPKPLAEAKPIAVDSTNDKYVVAINCDEYAAPPIGVTQPNQGGGEKWWAFPVRRGSDNRNLRPEELATIMEPRVRRNMLLLNHIPTYAPQNVRRAAFHSRPGSGYRTFDILSFDNESVSMHLRSTQDSFEVIVPLEAIRMIWRDLASGLFHVSLDGAIMPVNTGLEFRP